jgi:oligopeptide transport system permease protein
MESAEKQYGSSLWMDAWKRLRRNRLALASLIFLTILVTAVTIGPAIISAVFGYTYD